LYSVAVQQRLTSLDAFRGLTMAGMVIVNNPGTWDAMYWPLEHAEWHGCTPTDLIFPFFLFIVGVSLALSGQTLSAPWWRIARRAAVLVGLGLFLAGFPFFNPAHWRIPGILQRIGLCYIVAATVYRGVQPREHDDHWRRPAYALSAVVVAILVAYWIVMIRFGDLTPEGNIGAQIDRALMSGHLYRPRWDPEGLLSSVPAVATTLVGVVAGLWLRSSAAMGRKVLRLACAGIVLLMAGQLWGWWFPINKQLWTSSYVLFTAGAALVILAACVQLIDVLGVRAWSRPFVILGRNAITLFVLSGLVGKLLIILTVPQRGGQRESLQWVIYERGFAWMAAQRNASLIYSLAFLVLMYAVCDVLYRRQIFLRA
jgi:predicted acyltransferase